jgi:NMD protein affecting ribosome stability and mRNA decay
MATILVCVDCGAEIEIFADGDANLESLCRKCQEKLMRELAPIGFPKHRTLVPQIDGPRVWREPRG